MTKTVTQFLATSRRTVVEHSPHHHKVEVSSRVTAAGTMNRKWPKKVSNSWSEVVAYWYYTHLIITRLPTLVFRIHGQTPNHHTPTKPPKQFKSMCHCCYRGQKITKRVPSSWPIVVAYWQNTHKAIKRLRVCVQTPWLTSGLENDQKSSQNLASNGSILVEHSPHHHKGKGSSPAISAHQRKRKWPKEFQDSWPSAYWQNTHHTITRLRIQVQPPLLVQGIDFAQKVPSPIPLVVAYLVEHSPNQHKVKGSSPAISAKSGIRK